MPPADNPSSATPLLQGKRTFDHENGNDDKHLEERSSPVKKPKLDAAAVIAGDMPENVTKVADSPITSEQTIEREGTSTDHLGSDKPVAVDKLKQEEPKEDPKEDSGIAEKVTQCIKEEEVISGSCRLSQIRTSQEDEERQAHSSQVTTKQSSTSDECKQPCEGKGSEQDELALVFSDEDDEVGGSSSRSGGAGKMLNSQMTRQIDRVQVFLKLERLRRPKK